MKPKLVKIKHSITGQKIGFLTYSCEYNPAKYFIFVKNKHLNTRFIQIKLVHLKSTYSLLLILLFPFIFQNICWSQNQKILRVDSIILPNESQNQFLQILEDPKGQYSIDSVKKSNSFELYNPDIKLNTKSFYWSKIKIESGFDQITEVIFQIGGKRSSDFAELYFYNNQDSLLKHALSGYFVERDKKDIKREIGSKFMIRLEPGKSYTLYFRINNISGFAPQFDLKILDKQYFNDKLNRRNLVQGMLQGALWMMFLYNLFIFFYSRDKVYLYYSFYIIGIALNFVVERGLFVEYTIPHFPKLDPYFFILATAVAAASYFQFIRYFINTKKHMPKWDIAHQWVIGINLTVSAILLLVLLVSFQIPYSVNISNYLNLLGLIYGFVFIYYLIQKNHKLSWFFAAGALVLAIGTFISLYFLITKKPIDFDPKYFMNGATIAELLIFSLGLGYRIRLNEKAKQLAQIELIEQLKQNDQLRQKVNRELETRVKMRTAEIEQQNEEIIAQSESLKSANEVLIHQKREIENKNDEISQQKRYLEKIHQNTTDSINYASRIQNVILPSQTELTKYFNGHFIYYKPKEIVSGDFYWYRYIERDNQRYFAIAAADATGHGVPGSLVSMLGISLLNETVIRNEVNKASQVLERLRDEVKTTFSNYDDLLLTRDGIDMAFCVINLDTLEMQFSGANRPLVIFKNDPNKGTDEELKGLVELKPTKNPIGKHPKELNFTNQIIQLEKGDVIYLFSDGYGDQIGGPEGRKFYFKRLKELLSEIYKLPLTEQKQIIDHAFQDWINHQYSDGQNFRQVDDILIMGIRI